MLNKLKFKYKILLLPTLAACGFLIILITTQILGTNNESLFKRIDTGYAPAVELSRDQIETLSELRRAMQDAVASEDEEQLAATKILKDKFLQHLAEAKSNTVLESGELSQI